jgi:hypothetical protein
VLANGNFASESGAMFRILLVAIEKILIDNQAIIIILAGDNAIFTDLDIGKNGLVQSVIQVKDVVKIKIANYRHQ